MGAEVEDRLERVRRFAMPEGDVEPRDIRFSQEGEMRLAPDRPWRPFRAEQWMSGASHRLQLAGVVFDDALRVHSRDRSL